MKDYNPSDYWGFDENDNLVDYIIPLLVKIAALLELVGKKNSEMTDAELSIGCNLISAEDQVLDAIAACRAYTKCREREMDPKRAANVPRPTTND